MDLDQQVVNEELSLSLQHLCPVKRYFKVERKEIFLKQNFGKGNLTTVFVSSLLLDVSNWQEDLTTRDPCASAFLLEWLLLHSLDVAERE